MLLEQTSSRPIAKRAAVIITFYFQRDLMNLSGSQKQEQAVKERLEKELVPAFGLTPHPSQPQIWQNSTTRDSLYYFMPKNRAAHDTTVVQLALNAQEQEQSAASAWSQDLWYRLRDALNEPFLQGTIGYTLTYQAVLAPDALLSTLTYTDVVPHQEEHPLHLESAEDLAVLAVSDIAKGRVWLVKVPYQKGWFKPAIVYIAVCPEEVNDEFVKGALYGENTVLFMPDLIAHKSYHQIRQYQEYAKKAAYHEKVSVIRQMSRQFLAVPVANNKFRDFCAKKQQLTGDVALLDALRISLAKQRYNYNLHIKAEGETKIGHYHYQHMQVASDGLRLDIDEGQKILQAAESAIKLVETGLEKAEDKRQQLIGLAITVLSLVLAVPQLVDRHAAGALLALINGNITQKQIILLQLMGVQIFIIVLALLLIYLSLQVYKKWNGSK